MSRRSRAREIALQVLYQSDLNPQQADHVSHRFVEARLNQNGPLIQFTEQLLAGVRENKARIDEILESVAENWSLYRMSVTDRNILRIGAFEILFTETPDRVAINEAIELSKRYGAENSSQFVNGLLDRLMHSRPKDLTKPQPRSPLNRFRKRKQN